jgi:hypothetical protein
MTNIITNIHSQFPPQHLILHLFLQHQLKVELSTVSKVESQKRFLFVSKLNCFCFFICYVILLFMFVLFYLFRVILFYFIYFVLIIILYFILFDLHFVLFYLFCFILFILIYFLLQNNEPCSAPFEQFLEKNKK